MSEVLRTLVRGLVDYAATRRGFATSYGSCSFREPVDELRELRLL